MLGSPRRRNQRGCREDGSCKSPNRRRKKDRDWARGHQRPELQREGLPAAAATNRRSRGGAEGRHVRHGQHRAEYAFPRCIGEYTEDPSLQLKAVVETTPKLFGQLKDKLPVQNRESFEKTLLNGKTDAENITLHASYSFTSRRLGRNFAQHSALLNDLFEEAVAGPTSTRVIQRADLERKLIRELGTQVSLETTLWNTIPEKNRVAAEKVLLEAVQSDLALNAAFAAAVKDPGISLFGQLVNNQPQLSITGYRSSATSSSVLTSCPAGSPSRWVSEIA